MRLPRDVSGQQLAKKLNILAIKSLAKKVVI